MFSITSINYVGAICKKYVDNSTVKESIESTGTPENGNQGAKSTTTGEKGEGNIRQMYVDNNTVKESIESAGTSENGNQGAKSTTTGEKGKGNKQRGKKNVKTTATRLLQESLFQPSIKVGQRVYVDFSACYLGKSDSQRKKIAKAFYGVKESELASFKITANVVQIKEVSEGDNSPVEYYSIIFLDHTECTVRIESHNKKEIFRKIYGKETIETVSVGLKKFCRSKDDEKMVIATELTDKDITNETEDDTIMERCIACEDSLSSISLEEAFSYKYPTVDCIRDGTIEIALSNQVPTKYIDDHKCNLILGRHNSKLLSHREATVPICKSKFHRALATKNDPLSWLPVEEVEARPAFEIQRTKERKKNWKAHFNRNSNREVDKHFITSNDGVDRPLLHYFLFSFPMQYLKDIVEFTNEHKTTETQKTTKYEIMRFFGVLLVITLTSPEGTGSTINLWRYKKEAEEEKLSVFQKVFIQPLRNFLGEVMSFKKFQYLKKHISFASRSTYYESSTSKDQPTGKSSDIDIYEEDDEEKDSEEVQDYCGEDPEDEEEYKKSFQDFRWNKIRPFYNAFNEHRAKNLKASDHLCIDESMSRWYGEGGYWNDTGLPHYVAMDRKPDNGCEIWSLADGNGEFMLALEIVTSKYYNSAKKYVKNVGTGTAVCLRLMEPWLYKRKHLFGDSWFASVATCLTLLMNFTSFTGPVKTCTKGFPINELKRIPLTGKYPGHSAHKQTKIKFEYNNDDITSAHPVRTNGGVYTDNEFSLLATAWLDENSRRLFLTSDGKTTNAEKPIERLKYKMSQRYSEVLGSEYINTSKFVNTIQVPEFIDQYYKYHNIVDRHNRFRSILNIERKIKTKTWHFRIFCSLLGIIVVDAWLMYKNSRSKQDIEKKQYKDLKDFALELAVQLCSIEDNDDSSFVPWSNVGERKTGTKKEPNSTAETPYERRIEIVKTDKRQKDKRRKTFACYECPFKDVLSKKKRTHARISTECNICGEGIHRLQDLPPNLQRQIKDNKCISCLDSHICKPSNLLNNPIHDRGKKTKLSHTSKIFLNNNFRKLNQR